MRWMESLCNYYRRVVKVRVVLVRVVLDTDVVVIVVVELTVVVVHNPPANERWEPSQFAHVLSDVFDGCFKTYCP